MYFCLLTGICYFSSITYFTLTLYFSCACNKIETRVDRKLGTIHSLTYVYILQADWCGFIIILLQ